jgi:hypothetical protein
MIGFNGSLLLALCVASGVCCGAKTTALLEDAGDRRDVTYKGYI